MRKYIVIVRSNIRKARGQMAAIVVLILFASMMLNLGLMLSTDYKANFDRCHERLNAGHVTLVINDSTDELREYISQILENDSRAEQYCIDDVLEMVSSFGYNGGEINSEFVFLEKTAASGRSVGKIELVEEGGLESGIYFPMVYGTDPGISVGETLELTVGNHVVSYPVCGFINSAMAGSHNCSMCAVLLTKDQYTALSETDYAVQSTLVSVRLRDKAESEEFEAMLKNAVSSRYSDVHMVGNSYALVFSSRYISQMICSGIVCAMAFFVTLIALAVISSNVMNYIQENMKNLGALKAAGYTSGQLIGSLLLQFAGGTVITAIVGTALSYCLFPAVNTMMISQTGIPYTMHFLPLPFLLTLAVTGGTVALAVWLSARRIRKLEPVVALRQGILTHNFRRNHVPLEKTGLPLHLALAFKTTLSGVRQNVTVCITMLILSLIVVFSGLMLENVIVNMEPFVDLIIGETADSCISINAEIADDFLEAMQKDTRVEKIYLYHTEEVRHTGGIALLATVTDDFSEVNNQNVVFEGRFPRYDNEMAIAAKYARERGLKIGDEITLTAEGREADYIISGFTQISDKLGKDCLLTRSGYERMGRLLNESYCINTADGVDIEAFHEEMGELFGSGINEVINIQAVLDGSATVYISLMTIIVIAILLLSLVVITFVLYLLVRTMLNRKKRDYGVLKALGYTTGQLILQTAASFMPAVLLSTAAGITGSALVINPLIALFLSGIGIVKCTFTVPVVFITAAGAGLVLFAFGTACLLSLKIRKIAPRILLAGE